MLKLRKFCLSVWNYSFIIIVVPFCAQYRIGHWQKFSILLSSSHPPNSSNQTDFAPSPPSFSIYVSFGLLRILLPRGCLLSAVLASSVVSFLKLQWPPVTKQLVLKDAIMTYKYMGGAAPSCLPRTFTERSSIHKHKTSNCTNLQIPRYRASLTQRSFKYHAISLWNFLPEPVKQATSINIFKSSFGNT